MGRRMSVILLTAATAAIHFARAAGDPSIRVLFILNGLGYLCLITMLYLPQLEHQRRLVRRALIGYTTLTIVLFFVWGLTSGEWSVIGFVDKLIEVMLVGLLWREERAAGHRSPQGW